MGAVAARWHHEPASGTETASSRPRPPAPARNVRSFGDCGAPSATRAAAAAAAAHTHTHTHTSATISRRCGAPLAMNVATNASSAFLSSA